jgi:hypothetical protein
MDSTLALVLLANLLIRADETFRASQTSLSGTCALPFPLFDLARATAAAEAVRCHWQGFAQFFQPLPLFGLFFRLCRP